MILRIVILIALLSSVLAGIKTLQLSSLRATVAEERSKASDVARTISENFAARNQEIDRADQERKQATRTIVEADRRVADRARTDADGLRRALIAVSQRPAPTTTGCTTERATIERLGKLLSESAELVERGASVVAEGTQRGRELDDQVAGLKKYANSDLSPTPTPRP